MRNESFSYQAQSWNHFRRVVAKVEWHADELFPRVGFIVTKHDRLVEEGGQVLQRSRNGRAMDQGRQVCREADAAVVPELQGQPGAASAIRAGVQPGNFLRRLAWPRSVKHWSLTTLQEKLIKRGAKVVTHPRYVIFQMAEVAAPRDLFAAILERIHWFGVPPPLVQRG